MSTPHRCTLLSVWTFALAFPLTACREPAPLAPLPGASASVIAKPPALPVPGPEPEVALSSPAPELVVRDQPWLRGLRSWDGVLVAVGGARGDGAYRIEPIDRPELTRAVPLVLPGTNRVVDVAMLGDTPAALVITGGGLALALRRDASWSFAPVYDPACVPEDVILAADPDMLVLLCPGQLHVLRAGGWQSVPVGHWPVSNVLASRGRRHALLTADLLLVGFNAGEWGGALVSLDLATGAWKAYPQIDEPVTDLVAGPDGRPWVAEGISHITVIKGSLIRLDASGWKAAAKVEGSWSFVGGSRARRFDIVAHARLAWDLPPASFDAIAFDEEGRLHLLTGALGVVRRDGRRWTRLTPRWPEHIDVTGLTVRGTLLTIATFNAGVLLWNIATGKARRVALAQ
jgi:hypothetical protein